MASSPRLEFRDVSKRFANPRPNSRQGGGVVVAVEGVSLSIADGEVVSLIGPSGCGKSTLLKVMAGLIPPSAGEVSVAGIAPQEAARRRVMAAAQIPLENPEKASAAE